MTALKFILGLVVGFAVGWYALHRAGEPDLTKAELIEVDLLD